MLKGRLRKESVPEKSLPLILNFLPISKGGGLQNSLSLLQSVDKDPAWKTQCVAVVRRDSEIHSFCADAGMRYLTVTDSVSARISFELSCWRRFERGQPCFTIFGPPFLGSEGYLLNIVGCAYSNLLYPQIPFWSHYRWHQRVKRQIIDHYRRWGLTRADYWIFETPVLAERAVSLFGFPRERTGTVKMAASSLVSPKLVKRDIAEKFQSILPCGFKFLFLSSDNPNKRLHLLPSIAGVIRSLGITDFCFVTTLDERSQYYRTLMGTFRQRGLVGHLCNLGQIHPSDVASLIHCCGAICTFSVLESFSNNFVEAWAMGKPLVVTDADWARCACGPGAIYVNPEDAHHTAHKLVNLMKSSSLRSIITSGGKTQLRLYPDARTKNQEYFQHISKARAMGICPRKVKRAIKWKAENLGLLDL